jgi:ArsR family transcriptional regulator, lead/cadmium/zinc/bismuth-responsive transcriptional repressor
MTPVIDTSPTDACDVRVIHHQRLALARERALPVEVVEQLSLLYKALADPTRLRLLLALRDGEMCVCDLAALAGVSESAVSHQLRRLRDWGLVRNRREGQILFYSLCDDCVGRLLEVGVAHVMEA